MTKNANIIVLNKYLGEDRRDMYYPTFISCVFWHEVDTIRRYENSMSDDIGVVVRITEDSAIADGKTYIEPYEYDRLTASEKANYWTIQTGKTIIMKANEDVYSELIGGCDYTAIKEIGRKFVTAMEFSDNTDMGYMLKHYRIGGA